MIDPNFSKSGEEFEAYNIRRWGSSSWTHHLKQEGQKDGASFSNWKWWPHTLKAHQLVQYAAEHHGVPTSQTNAAIFHAMYEEGKNVSFVETLVDIAVEDLKIPAEGRNALRDYLERDEGAEQVKEEIRQGRSKYKISGVPLFIIEKVGEDSSRPYGLSGAQKSSTFLQVFEELLEEE